MVSKLMLYPIILTILVILLTTGCVQQGLQAGSPEVSASASPEHPVKASPVITDSPLPTKAPPQTAAVTAAPDQSAQFFDLAYTDRLWVLAGVYENTSSHSTAASLILEESKDGGASWEARSLPADAIQNGDFRARRAAFLDQNTGWVYGPGLFETQDGGTSWKEIHSDEEVAAILPAPVPGGQTWALEDTCPASGGNCSYRLLGLDPQTETLEPLTGYSALSADKDAAVIRVGKRTAYVLAAYFPGQDQYPYYAMWVAQGDGTGWKKLSIPSCVVAVFSLSPDGTFWLLCGDIPSAGNQLKALYVSSNQGKTWELRSATNPGPWAQSTPTPMAAKSLQTGGYVSDLLALSKDEALIGLDRDTLRLSTDGGRDWEEAIPFTASSEVEYFSWRLAGKPGSDEVWAAASALLFHSIDRGRSWSQLKTLKP